MSKKNKRQSRAGNSAATSPQPSGTTSNRAVSASPGSEPFNPDYSYVRKDLRRIGILAGVFLSILVFLSFFLR
jgi:hypothetical protein